MDHILDPMPSETSFKRELDRVSLPKSVQLRFPPAAVPAASRSSTSGATRQDGDTIELHDGLVAKADNSMVEASQPPSPESVPPAAKMAKPQRIAIIINLAGISFLNTMGSGILIAALPRIAHEVGLDESLILWPAAVYALAAGCLLLPFGAVADIIGAKRMWVTGSFLFLVFTLGVGLAKTGIQIIIFRTILGGSIAMCLPTAVSLITNTFPRGTWRNVAFAMNGMGQPLGYALGLVLGGIFTDTIGWRWAYYLSVIINGVISVASIWSLPEVNHRSPEGKSTWRRLAEDIDWIGAFVLSGAMGLLLYVLARTTSSYRQLAEPANITLLAVAVALLAAFPWWMEWQTKRGKPALIPNRLWKNTAFTSVCISVFFCWASLNGIEYFTTLFFQRVQDVSPLQSSLRFLPHVIMGTAVNILISYLISWVDVSTLAIVSAAITMISGPLMATVKVDSPYWLAPFWALLLSPANPDVLFTVSNLVISNAFPPEVQSLAGGVFNEVAQFGNSAGLAIMAAIAASVTEHAGDVDHKAALMAGYRAAFWTIFTATAIVLVVAIFGFRKTGAVGKKED